MVSSRLTETQVTDCPQQIQIGSCSMRTTPSGCYAHSTPSSRRAARCSTVSALWQRESLFDEQGLLVCGA